MRTPMGRASLSPVLSTVALFHRLRRRHRLAHPGVGRRQLWRLHRAGADHAVAADAERLQRLVRHLLPALHRHHLRTAVGAGVAVRDRDRLCRRGGDQVDDHRPDHPGDRAPVRAAAHRAPVLDDGVSGADRRHVQPVRLHHRHLG